MAGKKVVLITGTNSGLGRGLLDHYYQQGWDIVSVNRRADSSLAATYKGVLFQVLDIASYIEVTAFLTKLLQENKFPSFLFLNAGINRADNLQDHFDLGAFDEVLRTNLFGVMTFVAAARKVGAENTTFVGISSVSNIVPNPGHFAYYLSKWGIWQGFKLLQRNDPKNIYKTVVLGPVQTAITRNYGGPVGYQRKLFDFLSCTVEQSVAAIAAFVGGPQRVLYYPRGAAIFYCCARWLLKFLPFLYIGTRKNSDA